MKAICAYCKKEAELRTGDVNRAKKLGVPIYCNRVCAGLGRRVNRTAEEWKKIKADYDRQRRIDLADELKAKQKAYNESPAGRATQKRHRDKSKDYHKAYIQSDRYRQWKKEYDEKYVAQTNYGEFWEASIILNKIETILLPVRREVKVQKGTYNKSKQRKRHGTYRQKSQGITLGNPSRSNNW